MYSDIVKVENQFDTEVVNAQQALNTLRAMWRANDQPDYRAEVERVAKQIKLWNAHSMVPIEDGIYTIGSDSNGSEHVTIRIVPDWREDQAALGKQVAQYLSGSDNDSDYTGFAFIDQTRISVWRKAKGNVRVTKALRALMAGSVEERRVMGYNYAAASNRCWRCGKTLTVPASQMLGLGPICYEKIYG